MNNWRRWNEEGKNGWFTPQWRGKRVKYDNSQRVMDDENSWREWKIRQFRRYRWWIQKNNVEEDIPPPPKKNPHTQIDIYIYIYLWNDYVYRSVLALFHTTYDDIFFKISKSIDIFNVDNIICGLYSHINGCFYRLHKWNVSKQNELSQSGNAL